MARFLSSNPSGHHTSATSNGELRRRTRTTTLNDEGSFRNPTMDHNRSHEIRNKKKGKRDIKEPQRQQQPTMRNRQRICSTSRHRTYDYTTRLRQIVIFIDNGAQVGGDNGPDTSREAAEIGAKRRRESGDEKIPNTSIRTGVSNPECSERMYWK